MIRNYSSFDIFAYLDSRNISYKESGVNISKKYIGINCPFCANDNLYHLGIHKQSKAVTCWRCGTKGTILHLIQKVDNVPRSKAYSIFLQFQDQSLSYLDTQDRLPTENDVELPKGCNKNFAGIFANYLKQRNFDPEIIKQYNLYCGLPMTNYQYRIIIPVFYKHELVAYTGRDATNLSPIPYLHSSIEESRIPVKQSLYNLDTIKDKAIIVEGALDVWRIGRECVATFGIEYTKQQVALLLGLKKAFILFDAEAKAQSQAEALANDLSCFIDYVEVVTLDKGDPTDLDPIEALKIKNHLGF